MVWEAAARICGKRLKELLPTLLDAMGRHGHLDLDETALVCGPFRCFRVVRPFVYRHYYYRRPIARFYYRRPFVRRFF